MMRISVEDFNYLNKELDGLALTKLTHLPTDDFIIIKRIDETEYIKQLRLAIMKFESETGLSIELSVKGDLK